MTARSSPVTWLTAFLDLPADAHDVGRAFWSAVTGWEISAPRGEDGEFSTLLPPRGDPHVKIQRIGSATARTHLDVHVTDVEATATRSLTLGASLVERSPHGYIVLRSPGGYPYCLVHEPRSVPAVGTPWPDGHVSIVDQLCLDIPADRYESETAFWAALTGWDLGSSAARPEFSFLRRPAGIPVRLLLQRLGDAPGGAVTGHLDLAATDQTAEVARHESLGATKESRQSATRWTVLRDPSGGAYCITDRDPVTGLLPE